MDPVARWFAAQLRRDRRARYLEDALLGDAWWAYAWFRLRYFAARYLAATLIQSLKFLFLFHVFSRTTFLALILATACAGLATSFWWGALEQMRGRIRRLYRAGRPHLIAHEIARWLRLSVWLSIGLSVAAVGLVLGATQAPEVTFGLAHLYGIAVLIRLALEVVTRTLHSGIYAIRRVYRPMPAIVAVELASFLPVLALWPVVGAWAFPLALIVAALTSAGLGIHYTLRMYRFLGIELFPARAPRRPALDWRPAAVGELLGAGVSYAAMKMDAFLVIGLLVASGPVQNGIELFVLFFIIAPTVQASFDWAQLFYFDFKRLEIRLLDLLRQRYERQVMRLALLLGVAFWVLASGVGTLVYGANLGMIYGLLAPFFVSRSLLAFVQIRMFAAGQYGWLLLISVGLAGVLALAGSVEDAGWRMTAVSLAVLAALAGLLWCRRTPAPPVSRQEPLAVLDWLALLRREPRRVRIRRLRLVPAPTRGEGRRSTPGHAEWLARQVAAQMVRRMRGAGAVTSESHGTLVWYEPDTAPARISDTWLTWVTSGACRTDGETLRYESGRAAAGAIAGRPRVDDPTRAPADSPASVTVDAVRRAFLERFPDGAVYAPDDPPPEFLPDLPPAQKRGILADACRFVRGRDGRRRSRFDVTAFCAAGRLRLIFALAPPVPRRKRAQWRTLVRQLNVRAAEAPDGAGEGTIRRPA